MKDVICDKCGTKMDRKQCDGTFGVAAELYTCHKCGYAYETGIRYNPFIQDYVKYYKYLNYKKKNDFDDDVIDDNDTISLDKESILYVVGELQNYCLIEAERDVIADAFETLKHNLVELGDHNTDKALFDWPYQMLCIWHNC